MTAPVVLRLEQVPVGRAVCVLLGEEQVAVVRTEEGVFGLGNWDPIGRAMVMSRGLVGSRGDVDVLVSPLHKQAYDVRTGRCLDDPSVALPVFEVHVRGERVEIAPAQAQRRLA